MPCHYRCYFLGLDNRFKDVAELACTDDAAAIAVARQCFQQRLIFSGFELWQGPRRVHIERSPATR
jgi:hypothetical protein